MQRVSRAEQVGTVFAALMQKQDAERKQTKRASEPKEEHQRLYRRKKCGEPKKGHVCKVG